LRWKLRAREADLSHALGLRKGRILQRLDSVTTAM
jgi:hypothetical protein